ncbi:MAG: hypothetical protein Q9209_004847 [Squamulea sp. 1 TL-2023]
MVPSPWPEIHPVTASDLKSYVNQNRDHALALLQSVAESDGRGPTIEIPRGPLLVFITNVIGMCNIAPSHAGEQNTAKTLGSVDAKLTAFHNFIRDSRITCRMCGKCSDENNVVPQVRTHVQKEISQSDGALQRGGTGQGVSHIKDANHEQQIKPENNSDQRMQNDDLRQDKLATKKKTVNPRTDRNAKESSIQHSVVGNVMPTSRVEGHDHDKTSNYSKSANQILAVDQSMPSNCGNEENDSEDGDDEDTEEDSSVDEGDIAMQGFVQTQDANQAQDTSMDDDEGSEESASTKDDSNSSSTEEDEEETTPDTSMSDPIDVSRKGLARFGQPKQPKPTADATSSRPLPPTPGNKSRESCRMMVCVRMLNNEMASEVRTLTGLELKQRIKREVRNRRARIDRCTMMPLGELRIWTKDERSANILREESGWNRGAFGGLQIFRKNSTVMVKKI